VELGKSLRINLPQGTDSGKKFRLKGKGMPINGNASNYGDLIVKIIDIKEINFEIHLFLSLYLVLTNLIQIDDYLI